MRMDAWIHATLTAGSRLEVGACLSSAACVDHGGGMRTSSGTGRICVLWGDDGALSEKSSGVPGSWLGLSSVCMAWILEPERRKRQVERLRAWRLEHARTSMKTRP